MDKPIVDWKNTNINWDNALKRNKKELEIILKEPFSIENLFKFFQQIKDSILTMAIDMDANIPDDENEIIFKYYREEYRQIQIQILGTIALHIEKNQKELFNSLRIMIKINKNSGFDLDSYLLDTKKY